MKMKTQHINICEAQQNMTRGKYRDNKCLQREEKSQINHLIFTSRRKKSSSNPKQLKRRKLSQKK